MQMRTEKKKQKQKNSEWTYGHDNEDSVFKMKSYGLLTVVLLQTVLIIRAISTISISIKMEKKWKKKQTKVE